MKSSNKTLRHQAASRVTPGLSLGYYSFTTVTAASGETSHSGLLKEITLTVLSLPVPISFSSSQTQSLSFSGLPASGKWNPLHQETSNRKNNVQHRCTQWRLCL
ncbi:hypothetical protein AVEN_7289-1 [Araneus ventricosus]|uniref:Uncharacterized protein n=1 Tax=Araneus ventricosus TaxID=182803 RepID=A0A4Y1ZRX4_ARAVE|nr:hypothetical protein AVEN_7289-1 [Araneus ventricosus]